MENKTVTTSFDLTQLGNVELDDQHTERLRQASATCAGSPLWRQRKLAEIREVFALEQVSKRIAVAFVDLSIAIRIRLVMRVPVACLPDPAGPLRVEPFADLGLVYDETAVIEPQAGYNFICLLHPLAAWHPNISGTESGQRICLGPQLPAGCRIREIILMTYRALALQAAQFNLLDPAGVMNPAAADWWQRTDRKIPLTTETFLAPAQAIETAEK